MAKEKIEEVKEVTVEDIVEFVKAAGSDDLPTFGGTFEGGYHLQQVPDEIAPAIKAILDSEVTVGSYLEIGSAAGGTARLFCEFMKPSKVVLIDDNMHRKSHLRPAILDGIERTEIIGKSHDEAVLEKASALAPFDMIMIDGDHTYPGVKLDVMLFSSLLSAGGLLVLHDTALQDWGVARVARELKADSGFEFVGEWVSSEHPHPCGIAIFRKVAR